MKHFPMIVCVAFAVCVLASSSAFAQSTCVCGFGTSDDGVCFEDSFCFDRELCDDDGDCPAGQRCWVDNACPDPIAAGACAPVCDEPECLNPVRFDGFEECEPPLLIELSSFDAEFRGGVVHLQWATLSEIDNVGFRVFRVRQDATRRSKSGFNAEDVAPIALEVVTPRIIPAAGTEIQGAAYRHTDTAIARPGRYFYYLTDVDRLGKVTLHGPAEVVVPGGRADHRGR